MKRLLVCIPGVPHRSRGASTVLFYHYVDQLLEHGFEVLCILLLERHADLASRAKEFAREMESRGCRVEVALVDHYVRFHRLTGRLRLPPLPDSAVRCAAEFRADGAIYFDLQSLAVAGEFSKGRPRVVWLGDLAHEAIWHHARYDVAENTRALLRLPKLWLLCRRWRRAYRNLLASVERVIVSSLSSVQRLSGLGIGQAKYLPYPWPVAQSASGSSRLAGEPPRFLFCGTLTGLGSRSALHYLLDLLYPELLRRWGSGGFQIVITGDRSLPTWAAASIATKPEISFEGFVEDLFARMDKCHAGIFPIDVPVGNRSRIVTAMGYGLLVIAHPSTALGNADLVSGETCLLAHDPHEFAEFMARAYEDAEMRTRLTAAARRAYERSFEPRKAGAMLVAEVRSIL